MLNSPTTFSAAISNASDGDISIYLIKENTISLYTQFEAREKVMPLALSADNGFLFAATRGKHPALISYRLTAAENRLQSMVSIDITDDLVYLFASPLRRFLYGASYDAGQLIVYDLPGLLTGKCNYVHVLKNIPHAHCVVTPPDERFVYVSSLSTNSIHIFRWHNHELVADGVFFIAQDFGPRHLYINAAGGALYAVSEFHGTVAACAISPHDGRLTLTGISSAPAPLSHLQPGFARPPASAPIQPDPLTLKTLCWASEIQVTPDDRFVYIAERTSSRILVYGHDNQGQLVCQSWVETNAQPRCIRLTPDGRFLISCGEKSTGVSLYALSPATGELTLVSQCEGGRGANCIAVFPLQQ